MKMEVAVQTFQRMVPVKGIIGRQVRGWRGRVSKGQKRCPALEEGEEEEERVWAPSPTGMTSS